MGFFLIFLQFGDVEKVPVEELPLPLRVARGSSYALWSLAKSRKSKAWIKKSGGLSLLARLVRMRNTSIVIPAIGTLQVENNLETDWKKMRLCQKNPHFLMLPF